MPTAQQAHQDIVNQIEENRLEAAIAALLSFAEQYSPSKTTAVRMRRSDWKTLEEETLMMGETSGIRERRSVLKLQLFRLADAIRKDGEANHPSTPTNVTADSLPVVTPPYATPRGEGPINVFLAYAPDPADQAGGEELKKSMALLLHLKRVELFDQQKSPAGNRGAALASALNEAEIILLLLSNNFLSDLECLSLQEQAYRLYERNHAAVVPILYTPCEWAALDIGRLQALPRNGQFITQWDNADEAYAKISREVSELVKDIRARLAPSVLRTPSRHDAGTGSPRGEGGSELKPEDKPKPVYNTSELRAIFRKGNTGVLIQQLLNMTSQDGDRYDQVLLLEQRWNEVSEDDKNHTASQESITTRKNKLNQDILRLIREMGGG